MSGPSVVLRPLRREDFLLLRRWLLEPLVARWWNHETTPEALDRDFGPGLEPGDPTQRFVACLGDRAFGLIQRYGIADYPEYLDELSHVCTVPPHALSIDYLVGEPDLRGRGLGAAMISTMVAESWVARPAAADVIVPVAAGNRASWRALEAAGFERIAEGELEPDNPIDPRDHYVYRRQRPRIA